MTAPTDAPPEWAPRLPQWKIRRLYESDAAGMYDDELIDDVGYGLLARCQSLIAASEAAEGRATCPSCGALVIHHGDKGETLACACGWRMAWGDYFATFQHKQLSGAEPVRSLFREFIAGFPSARSARERMLLIDVLIHGFHYYYKDRSITRPVAVNLIEGRMHEVIAFLDSLSYGAAGTPGLAETKADWQTTVEARLRQLGGEESSQRAGPTHGPAT